MTIYSFIVLIALVAMAQAAFVSLQALRHQSRDLATAEDEVRRYIPLIGSTDFDDHFRHIDRTRGGGRYLAPMIIGTASEILRDDDYHWDKLEREQLAPSLTLAGGMTTAAPAIGLLFTALSISLGLAGGGSAGEVAERLLAALPSAFGSTCVAMAVTVLLTWQKSRTIRAWLSYRGAFGQMLEAIDLRMRQRDPGGNAGYPRAAT